MLGLGDWHVSSRPGDVIKTFALGTCVAVMMMDPKSGSFGMAHVVLPDSKINPAKAQAQPGYFADTAVPLLQAQLVKLGANPRMTVKICGGAQILDADNHFNVGKKNVLAVKKALWACKLGTSAEDTGGRFSRTVTLDSAFQIVITSPNKENWSL